MSESEKMLEELLRERIKTAKEAEDPEERKKATEDVRYLFGLQTGRKKVNDERLAKWLKIFGPPVLGVLLLIFYRILMETETSPDIFFRDIGKTICGLCKCAGKV